MTSGTILILLSIGLMAGILSGFVGIGGGVIIVPALVFALGLSQHEAQGTSLFVLMMPVVLLSVINYWKAGNVNWKFGLLIAVAFVIGGYIGSKLSLKLSPGIVKLIFGVIMAFLSFRLILSGYNAVSNES
ncbi:MAG: sulfite exporter TauE/SafE family protein [Bacteroidetes bacterium]|nr:MAG: sulfite exporter TauE/SafE family protein [Bacteroidota bacterium]